MKRLMAAALALASVQALAGPAIDVTVETSNGNIQKTVELWKRPTVLFYEDRDSNTLNQHLKDALFKAGSEKGLTTSVDVVAVANVQQWNWFPARNFVLSAVRDIEKKVHVPIYLDFTGALSAAPWNLPSKSSTVVVLSAQGEPLLMKKGRLSDKEVDEVFALLAKLVSQQPAVP